LFRYIRYNGFRRSNAILDDDTPAIADDVEVRPRATRLGTLDPETSEIVWLDEAGDTTGS